MPAASADPVLAADASVASRRPLKRVASVDEIFDPLGLPRFAARVGRIELPGPQKRLDQRPDRLGARLELEDSTSGGCR